MSFEFSCIECKRKFKLTDKYQNNHICSYCMIESLTEQLEAVRRENKKLRVDRKKDYEFLKEMHEYFDRINENSNDVVALEMLGEMIKDWEIELKTALKKSPTQTSKEG